MLLLTWKPGCNSALSAKSAVPPRWMVTRVEGATLSTALPGAWARKQGQGAARSNRSAGARRIEQLNDGIFEILFPHGDSDVNRCNLPLPVDQQRSGQRVQPAVRGADLVVAQQDAIVHLHVLDVGLDGGPAVFIHGYPHHGEAFIFELPLEIHEPGNLDFAGAAPGGPEVQQHHFTLVVGGMNGLSVGIFQLELRHRLSHRVLENELNWRGGLLLNFRRCFYRAKIRASSP